MPSPPLCPFPQSIRQQQQRTRTKVEEEAHRGFEKGGPDRCVYLFRPLPLCSSSSTCCFSRCCRPPYLGARERPQTGARRKGTQKDERYDVKEMGGPFPPDLLPVATSPGRARILGVLRRFTAASYSPLGPERPGGERSFPGAPRCVPPFLQTSFFRVTRAAELNEGKAGKMCPERKATTRIATILLVMLTLWLILVKARVPNLSNNAQYLFSLNTRGAVKKVLSYFPNLGQNNFPLRLSDFARRKRRKRQEPLARSATDGRTVVGRVIRALSSIGARSVDFRGQKMKRPLFDAEENVTVLLHNK